MKVGIVGCGKIADEHCSAIQTIPGAEIVGVCDREELMAQQMSDRFRIPRYFSDVHELFSAVNPQVVHITTPPQVHFELARICIEAGCSVFIEKPFTLNTAEAETLIRLATKQGVKLTVGHNHQFSHAAVEMRSLVRGGFLGSTLVHMESIFGYNLGDERYAKALLGDKHHWVRKLPGKLLHNVINHGISKIAEFLQGDSPEVIVCGFPSSLLKRINEKEIIDEVRVIIRDKNNVTAYFTFSSQMRPVLHQFRIHGEKNSLFVDYNHQVVIQLKKSDYRSYLNQFVPPLLYGKQFVRGGLRNIGKFLCNEFHQDTGRRRLIKLFYGSVTDGTPPPIPYREILCTRRIMDMIFDQLHSSSSTPVASLRQAETNKACKL